MTKRQARQMAKTITQYGYRVTGYRLYTKPRCWTVCVLDIDGTPFEAATPESWEALHATR